MNQNDFYAKIVKIIESCKTPAQLYNFWRVWKQFYFRDNTPKVWIDIIRKSFISAAMRL